MLVLALSILMHSLVHLFPCRHQLCGGKKNIQIAQSEKFLASVFSGKVFM